MEKIVFGGDLIVGIEMIDSQHRELIDKINLFLDGISRGDTRSIVSELEKMLDFMIEYAEFHFSEEEKLMEEHSCAVLDVQRMQHQFFIAEANKLKFDLKTGGISPELLEKSQKLLVDWIKSHITGMDRKIKECLDKGG